MKQHDDQNDIVTLLRVLNHHAKKLAEIESLHELYRDAFSRCEELTLKAAVEIKQLRQQVADLRAERDDARRRLCAELLEVEGHPFGWKGARGARGIAERLGWDCFEKEA